MGKQDKIIDMFNSIAPTYDRVNRVLSMGIDLRWRREACDRCLGILPRDAVSILDLACGTGDMISAWQASSCGVGTRLSRLVGIDPSVGMLQIARQKLGPSVELLYGSATQLPVDSESMDILSIAYGLRNVVDRERALCEIGRVLKVGGMVVILDFFSDANPSLLGRLMRFYVNRVLPFVGGIVSRNLDAYRYLPRSIHDFVTIGTLIDEFRAVGFNSTFSGSYSFGISTLLIFQKTGNLPT